MSGVTTPTPPAMASAVPSLTYSCWSPTAGVPFPPITKPLAVPVRGTMSRTGTRISSPLHQSSTWMSMSFWRVVPPTVSTCQSSRTTTSNVLASVMVGMWNGSSRVGPLSWTEPAASRGAAPCASATDGSREARATTLLIGSVITVLWVMDSSPSY